MQTTHSTTVDTEQSKKYPQDALFSQLEQLGHEEVTYCYDKETSLKAVIAIHSTTLGPALGGVRMWDYASEQKALTDVLRLSRGMTFKAAISDLNLGGGKAIIMGNAKTSKTEAMLRRFGQFVEDNGRYITSSDVGMDTKDMLCIRQTTKNVTGLPESEGGGGGPETATAYGAYLGIKAAAKKMYGTDNLANKKIIVQGVGLVGTNLVKYLIKENAKVTVSDIIPEKINHITKHLNVDTIEPEKIYDLDMDIYAPCALGFSLNDTSIPRLNCSIIAGSANNQLADEDRHDKMLQDRGILYVPDFLINAGGLINVCYEYLGDYNRKKTYLHIEKIYHNCFKVFSMAENNQITTHKAAMQMAVERLSGNKKANTSHQ